MTALNGMILCKEGMHQYDNKGNTLLSFCHGCYSSLNKNKIPHFALVNRLYKGALLKEFGDITWVKEMVCAIFRTTAHVTLYESLDSKQPFVYHGNSCAHEVNVVSTASVLLRTPGDIKPILTVVVLKILILNTWVL